jgi:hypothetical protein
MSVEQNGQIPNLPCPNCQENLLANGFYNYCTETNYLREDNYTEVVGDKLYIDHTESSHETVDHECDMEARCGSCDAELPSPHRIRGLDGEKLSDIPAMIVEILGESDGVPAAPPAVSALESPTEEQHQ